jgi:hypothetical protein
MRPVYARLVALLGPGGALYAYSDDIYLLPDPTNMSIALAVAPPLYKKVGLRIGGGPDKPKLILLPGCIHVTFLLRLHIFEEGLPHIVTSFSA